MAYFRRTPRSLFIRAYIRITLFLEKFMGPLLYLAIRLWMGRIFWNSGLTKIESWSTAVALFENEYKVPFFNPEVAAYITTTTEVICSPLLVVGLASRLAALPMLAMTAV